MTSCVFFTQRNSRRKPQMFLSPFRSSLRVLTKGEGHANKGESEIWRHVNKLSWEREMKTYSPTLKEKIKKKFKHHNAPRSPPLSFLLVLSITKKSEEKSQPIHWWGCQETGWDVRDNSAEQKQCHEQKAAKLKKKYKKDIVACWAKGKHDAAKKGGIKAEKGRWSLEKEKSKRKRRRGGGRWWISWF